MHPRSQPSQLLVVITGDRILAIQLRLRLLLGVCWTVASLGLLTLGIARAWPEALLMLLAVAIYLPVGLAIAFADPLDFRVHISIRRFWV